MNLVAYTRRSSDKQVASQETQELLIREWCKQNNHVLIHVYHEVPIVGKSEIERRTALPMLIAAIRDRKTRQFEGVVVWKMDRLCRNKIELHRIVGIFDKHKCQLLSVMDPVKRDTASDRFVFNILADVAELEREQLGERVYGGFLNRFMKGKYIGRHSPMGLEWNEQKAVFEITDRAQDVVTIFETYIACNGSYSETARRINDAGMLSSSGIMFSSAVVRDIIRQPAYRQIMTFVDRQQHVPNVIPRIVPEDLIAQAEPLIAVASRNVKRSADKIHAYSGMMCCSQCGGTMIVGGTNIHGNHYVSWKCRTKSKYSACDSRMVSNKYIDPMIGLAIGEVLNLIKSDVEVADVAIKPDISIDNAERNLMKLSQQRTRYIDAYARGFIKSPEELLDKINPLDKQIEQLKLDMLGKNKPKPIDRSAVMDALETIGEDWADIPEDEKRGLLLQIGAKVTVDTVKEKGRPHRIEFECGIVSSTIAVECVVFGTRWGIKSIYVCR